MGSGPPYWPRREFARTEAIAHLALDVWAFNVGARRFYERHGFAVMRQELWSRAEAGAP